MVGNGEMAMETKGKMDGKTKDGSLDLGRRYDAEIKPKASPRKVYPSLYLDGLPKESPLVKKSVGEVFECPAGLRVKRMSENDDGTWTVELEARSLAL